jgi:hypothetical protein
MISLLQRIRLRRTPPSQDGDTRAPVLINFPASDHAVFAVLMLGRRRTDAKANMRVGSFNPPATRFRRNGECI